MVHSLSCGSTRLFSCFLLITFADEIVYLFWFTSVWLTVVDVVSLDYCSEVWSVFYEAKCFQNWPIA